MDQHFRKRWQKTFYCGELEPEHTPLALTELCVEYIQNLAPHKLDHVDLQSASILTSQESVSPSSVMMSMIYAKRLQRKRPDHLKRMSSSDLFFLSMMMASKYLYDEGVDEEVFNDEWAETAGMEKDDVNCMEREFLDAMDWELFIKKDEFDQAVLSVERSIAFREGMKQGWFSYTDLCLLWDDPRFQLIAQNEGLEWIKVMMVSTVAYVAAVLTMVGSTVLVANMSLVLASSGMLPASLHTVQTPVPFQPLLPTQEQPIYAVSPRDRSALLNETAINPEEGSDSAESEMPGTTVLDTIMSQLMAVLTLKSHMLQFVQAVSDNFTNDRLHLSAKKHSWPATSLAPPVQVPSGHWESKTKRCCNAGSPFSSCFQIIERMSSSTDLERWSVFYPGCDMDQVRASYAHCLLQQSLCCHECSHGLDRKSGQKQGEYLDDYQGIDLSECCDYSRPSYKCGVESRNPSCSGLEAETNMPYFFLDITIGFATSMPPLVFST